MINVQDTTEAEIFYHNPKAEILLKDLFSAHVEILKYLLIRSNALIDLFWLLIQ